MISSSSFDTSNVTNMTSMFEDGTRLTTIYVSDKWTTAKVTSSDNMFYECKELTGGNGTKYDANNVTATYACVDTASKKRIFYTVIINSKAHQKRCAFFL